VPSPPLIGVVVVNYFGGERTMACLEAVQRSTWPADGLRIVLVDNGSEPEFTAAVRERFPAVAVVVAGRNLGLAGAVNLGIEAVSESDYVALLNNDAIPAEGWLEPLVDAFARHPRAGAVTPKVLLDGRFVSVRLDSPTSRGGRDDPRSLGVQLCGARVGGVDVTESIELVQGFWGWETDTITVGGPFAWTAGPATALVPVPEGASRRGALLELKVACGVRDTEVSIEVDGQHLGAPVGPTPVWVATEREVVPSDVINNAGLLLRSDWRAADRGYLQADDATFDEEVEVFGWSGAAVLLRRRYLEDVGPLDPHLFLYYEDVDLSWRGRLRGWETWYVPTSTVRHERSATVGRRSALAQHLSDRNRLIVLAKCAPRKLFAAALGRELRDLGRGIVRDVIGRVLELQRPSGAFAITKVRVLGGFARQVRWAFGERRRIRSRATSTDSSVLAPVVEVDAPGRLDPHRRARRADAVLD
jgi:GT2 family glycosyltransferase